MNQEIKICQNPDASVGAPTQEASELQKFNAQPRTKNLPEL